MKKILLALVLSLTLFSCEKSIDKKEECPIVIETGMKNIYWNRGFNHGNEFYIIVRSRNGDDRIVIASDYDYNTYRNYDINAKIDEWLSIKRGDYYCK